MHALHHSCNGDVAKARQVDIVGNGLSLPGFQLR
jgi:hypothetical protein